MGTKVRRSTANARASYTEKVNAIDARLTTIRSLVQCRVREMDELHEATGKGATWGNVGEMAYLLEGLDAVVRQLTGEEE